MQELCEIGPYVVHYAPGTAGSLAISFASIGHDPARLPSPEFVATATGSGTSAYPRPALFVQDRARSWANDTQFEPMLRQALGLIPPAQKMVAIGMSMGGFSALVASLFLPLKAVLAFVPQWSILPEIMPQETRWQEWRKALPPIRWPSCPLPELEGCHRYLFHAGQDDLAHALRFPQRKQCDHMLFAEHHHSELVPALKAKGVLSGLMDAAFQEDRRRLLRIAHSAGGKRLAEPSASAAYAAPG